jgi:hypothetical protein
LAIADDITSEALFMLSLKASDPTAIRHLRFIFVHLFFLLVGELHLSSSSSLFEGSTAQMSSPQWPTLKPQLDQLKARRFQVDHLIEGAGSHNPVKATMGSGCPNLSQSR